LSAVASAKPDAARSANGFSRTAPTCAWAGLEDETLCRFQDVVGDLTREKGFLEVEISHDTRPRSAAPKPILK
jgi:hypothetical protein